MIINETKDYGQLVELFIRNGLEFSKEKPVEEAAIERCWKAEQDDKLIAGCMLTRREGHYKLEGLAVESPWRNSEIGSKLLARALNHIKERNAANLYLVAKVPGFYKKHGFKTIAKSEAPIAFKCFTCSQYQATCFPEVMKFNV